jgi:hypothetical protein
MDDRLFISPNGATRLIGPEDPHLWPYYESLVAADYARAHPGDSFEGLKRRARFSKEDKGLLSDWMATAAARAGAAGRAGGPSG